jgi:carotenoid 1,2-hydratase
VAVVIPPFDQHVPRDGYAWWYLDAVSDDGLHGITVIAFIGSVFSPFYAWARAHGQGDPLEFCAVNAALYGPRGRWCMTERPAGSVSRGPDTLAVGSSALAWDGDALTIALDEWAVPLPRRIRGRIRVRPSVVDGDAIALDPGGLHHWTPVSPAAHVEVTLTHPALRWSGTGYLDHNAGGEPLERSFDNWFWSRAATRAGPVVLYETQLQGGARNSLAFHFDTAGRRHPLPVPREARLPRSRWGVDRPTRSDDGEARLEQTWEDTPFYARSLVSSKLRGERVLSVHESLSLRRFATPWVQMLLPFRIPRRSR